MKTSRYKQVLTYVLLVCWSTIVGFPFYWMIVTSLKTAGAVSSKVTFFPWIDFQPSISAWNWALNTLEVQRAFRNSIIIGLGSSILSLIVGSMAAYGLSRFKYRVGNFDNDNILFWIISQRMLPAIVVVIPMFIMFRILGLTDTHLGMILIYGFMNLPFVVWLMKSFFDGLPIELEEAALIDGCSMLKAFVHIVIPVVSPGFVATFMFVLVFAWNEFLFALSLTFNKANTLPLYIAGQHSIRGTRWWDIAALSLLMIVPVIFLAIFLEKYLISGLLKGSDR